MDVKRRIKRLVTAPPSRRVVRGGAGEALCSRDAAKVSLQLPSFTAPAPATASDQAKSSRTVSVMSALLLQSPACAARPRSARLAQARSPCAPLRAAPARLHASGHAALQRRSHAPRPLRVVAAAASAPGPGPSDGKKDQKTLVCGVLEALASMLATVTCVSADLCRICASASPLRTRDSGHLAPRHAQAPSVPVSPVGEFLTHMLKCALREGQHGSLVRRPRTRDLRLMWVGRDSSWSHLILSPRASNRPPLAAWSRSSSTRPSTSSSTSWWAPRRPLRPCSSHADARPPADSPLRPPPTTPGPAGRGRGRRRAQGGPEQHRHRPLQAHQRAQEVPAARHRAPRPKHPPPHPSSPPHSPPKTPRPQPPSVSAGRRPSRT